MDSLAAVLIWSRYKLPRYELYGRAEGKRRVSCDGVGRRYASTGSVMNNVNVCATFFGLTALLTLVAQRPRTRNSDLSLIIMETLSENE